MKLFKDLPSTETPVNAENLNQIQDKLVVVSATEPTGDNREKVWIQKGKNLIDISKSLNEWIGDNGLTGSSTVTKRTGKIKIKANTDYIFSCDYTTLADTNSRTYAIYDNEMKFVSLNYYGLNSDKTKVFRSSVDGYIDISYDTNYINVMLEQGSTATSYEAYIEPKIYVLNYNGVYEKFYRKEDINDLITTQNFTSSEITVATNSFKTSSILVKKAGYTPKGIVMADMSNNNVILSKFSLFGTTVYINLLNYSGSDQTTTVTVKVLYAKTTN